MFHSPRQTRTKVQFRPVPPNHTVVKSYQFQLQLLASCAFVLSALLLLPVLCLISHSGPQHSQNDSDGGT